MEVKSLGPVESGSVVTRDIKDTFRHDFSKIVQEVTELRFPDGRIVRGTNTERASDWTDVVENCIALGIIEIKYGGPLPCLAFRLD
jgi:hypothetical protein